MTCYLGLGMCGVDYVAWTEKPRWAESRHRAGEWFFRSTGGCTMPGLHCHIVERELGVKLQPGELAELEVNVRKLT
jgi:hypothetical protein